MKKASSTRWANAVQNYLNKTRCRSRKKGESPRFPRRTLVLGLGFLLSSSPSLLHAQASNGAYADYPQHRGLVEPLQWNALPSWVTVGGELRGRLEGQTSYSYTENRDRVYFLTRDYLNLEIRPAKFLTGYIQSIDTHALGLPLHAVAANMRDVFDDRQAYLNIHFKAATTPIQLIGGRQELKFGSERVIGISDWTNNSRTWDGFDARIGDKNRVDLFSTSVVAVHPSSLDKHGAGLTFHGAYGSITTLVPKTRIDPYVLIRTVRGVTGQQSLKGNEVEVTFGAEAQGQLPAGFDYEINGSLQRGSYANDSIHAGQSFGKFNYSLPRVPWRPRLGGEYDFATGNSRRNLNRISTYDQQYPSNHNAFGLTDLFGFQNIRQERLNLDLGPTQNLTFLVQGEFLNLVNTHDSLYSSSGSVTVRAPTAGFASDAIGTGIDFSGKYVYHSFLVANMGLGHVFPGAMLLANNHGAAQTLGYFSLTYRFRVDKHAATPQATTPGTGTSKTH